MKKLFYSLLFLPLMLASCQNSNQEKKAGEQTATECTPIDYSNVKDKSFADLFAEIRPDEIKESPFDLFPKVHCVLTSGKADAFNSMVIGEGGFGNLIGKDITMCGLRGSRYTLEIILKEHTYTMSFFDEQFREQFMPFGMASGRDTDKMKQTTLTPVATPSGNMTYKEAKLVVECQLAQTHTVNMDEVYAEKNRQFFKDAHESVGSYHKIVIGDITNVWVRK